MRIVSPKIALLVKAGRLVSDVDLGSATDLSRALPGSEAAASGERVRFLGREQIGMDDRRWMISILDQQRSGSFSADGQRVVTASRDNTARVWDVLIGSAADSEELAELAEVVGGYTVTGLGYPESIPPKERSDRLAALRQLGSQAPDNEPTVASFIRWYFKPRWERTISPLSKMTVEEYLRQLLDIDTEEALREAESTFPGHPMLTGARARSGNRSGP